MLQPFLDKVDVVLCLLTLSIFTTKKITREEKYLRELALATKQNNPLYWPFGRYKGLEYLVKAIACYLRTIF